MLPKASKYFKSKLQSRTSNSRCRSTLAMLAAWQKIKKKKTRKLDDRTRKYIMEYCWTQKGAEEKEKITNLKTRSIYFVTEVKQIIVSVKWDSWWIERLLIKVSSVCRKRLDSLIKKNFYHNNFLICKNVSNEKNWDILGWQNIDLRPRKYEVHWKLW